MIDDRHSPHRFTDYKAVGGFAEDYLSTYYRIAPADDERAVIGFVSSMLSEIELPRLPNGLVEHLEVACGPTLHHALTFTRYVDAIYMADYLEENLEQVRRWIAEDPRAHSWTAYADWILSLQSAGAPREAGDASPLERETRAKIAGLLHCDLMRPEVLDEARSFSSVACFYGAEAVALDKQSFGAIVSRLASNVTPGGYFFLSCLSESSSYVVSGSAGVKRELPAARVSKDDLAELLGRPPFAELHLVEARIGSEAIEGVSKILLAAARVAGR